MPHTHHKQTHTHTHHQFIQNSHTFQFHIFHHLYIIIYINSIQIQFNQSFVSSFVSFTKTHTPIPIPPTSLTCLLQQKKWNKWDKPPTTLAGRTTTTTTTTTKATKAKKLTQKNDKIKNTRNNSLPTTKYPKFSRLEILFGGCIVGELGAKQLLIYDTLFLIDQNLHVSILQKKMYHPYYFCVRNLHTHTQKRGDLLLLLLAAIGNTYLFWYIYSLFLLVFFYVNEKERRSFSFQKWRLLDQCVIYTFFSITPKQLGRNPDNTRFFLYVCVLFGFPPPPKKKTISKRHVSFSDKDSICPCLY